MKRYETELVYDGPGIYRKDLTPSHDGEWVKYEDLPDLLRNAWEAGYSRAITSQPPYRQINPSREDYVTSVLTGK